MFSQLGKREEWMPEDSLGGFCLGKHPACGRHWERLSMCTGPVDWETSIFSLHIHLNALLPHLSPCAFGTPFLWQFVPLRTVLSVSFLLSLFGTDGQLFTTHCACVSWCSLSTWACSLCSDSSSEEGEHWVTHSWAASGAQGQSLCAHWGSFSRQTSQISSTTSMFVHPPVPTPSTVLFSTFCWCCAGL